MCVFLCVCVCACVRVSVRVLWGGQTSKTKNYYFNDMNAQFNRLDGHVLSYSRCIYI